jgi:hypothetical protein
MAAWIMMDTIFAAYSYRSEDKDKVRPIVTAIETLLASHDVRVATGESLGGGLLTPEIQRRITDADGLIAVVTGDTKKPSGKYTPHPWVRDELNYARGINRPSIALVESSVDVDGAYQEHEIIRFGDGVDALISLSKLAHTIGLWKRERGRRVKIRILPDDLGARCAKENSNAVCEYRFIRNGKATEWMKTSVFGEIGGTFVYAAGAQFDVMVEVRIKVGKQKWQSKATPEFITTQLFKENK